MTHARRRRTARCGCRFLLPLFVLVVGFAGPAASVPLAAQQEEIADSLAARQGVYQREYDAWRAALTARELAERQLGEAITQYETARVSGNDEALSAAQRAAQGRAREVEALDTRVRQVEARLAEARERLLEALDARQVLLQEQLVAATTPVGRERIGAFVEDLQNRYRELEEAAQATVEVPPDYYPALSFDVRDGREEWRLKAQLLERKAETAAELIEEAQRTLDRLEGRLRLERTRQDTRANRDRFGDALPPVGTTGGGVGDSGDIVADTTGVALERLPLEQQIEFWEAHVTLLEVFRQRLLAQSAEFRARLNRAETAGGDR